MKEKLVWVEWMKFLAMFFVVWGHCFPETMSDFVYAFNVPVFFVISGFLAHKAESNKAFYKKLTKTLLVPYLLLAYIKGLGAICKEGGVETVVAILGGFHSIGETQGCSNLWFVYSLIVIKILHNLVGYSAKKMWVMLVVSVVSGAIVFGSVEMPKWAVSDAVLAMPFYAVGYLLAFSCRETVLELVEKIVRKRVVVLMSVVMMSIVLFWIGGANGQVGMYKGYYGNSILLFLLGGMMGSIIVFMVSAMLSKVKRKFVSVIAAGNIVVLVFHRELLHSPLKMIANSDLLPVYKDMLSGVLSLAVLFCFVPVCWLLIKYVPIVVGCRKV